MTDTPCQTKIKYACPRCANRTIEQVFEGYDSWWCSICFSVWEIEPFKEYDPYDSSHTKESLQ